MLADKILEIRGLSAGYGELLVLKNVNLHIDRGEILAVLGPNGSGKSTLLKSVLGLVDIFSGEIYFEGRRIDKLSVDLLPRLGIGSVLQSKRVFPYLTVEENLKVGGYTQSHEIVERRIAEIYEIFPFLKTKKKLLAGNLSGGEQEMLSIARALTISPKLLLIDEPSIGLSPIFVDRIYEKLKQINDRGTAIMLVEQNVQKALELSNRVILLVLGEKRFDGTPTELQTKEDLASMYLGIEIPKQ